jgi:hypothetical protein
MRFSVFMVVFLFLANSIFSQAANIAQDWENKVLNTFEKTDLNSYIKYDFSSIISNQNRIKNDPWSSYIGVFGPKNRRIDFHLSVTKTDKDKIYKLIGKSKLGDNIREVHGEIKVKQFLKTNWTNIIMIYEYKLKEPGNRVGDGYFSGIGTISFEMYKGQPKIYWSAAGEYRLYNNMFVGYWNRYNSDYKVECIFTFLPSGTHNRLPYRADFYKEFNENDECKCFYEIKDKYRDFGWQDYDDGEIKKEKWW